MREDPSIRGRKRLHELLSAIRALEPRGARVWECAITLERRSVPAVEIGPSRARALSIVVAGADPRSTRSVEALVGWLEAVVVAPPASRRLIVLPILDPDGRAALERRWLGSPRVGSEPRRRVDLDRDWPTGFRARRWPSLSRAETDAPLSAPETRGVSAAIDAAVAKGAADLRAIVLEDGDARVTTPHARWLAHGRDAAEHLRDARDLAQRLGPPFVASSATRHRSHATTLEHLHEAWHARALGVALGPPSGAFNRIAGWLGGDAAPDDEGRLHEALSSFLFASPERGH